MTAPMRSVPAMPAMAVGDVGTVRRLGIDVFSMTSMRRWVTPHFAYCVAQAAADRDGKRRRVFKDGDVWRIEVALVHNHGPNRGAGLDCPERIVRGRLRGACMDGVR